MIKYNSYIQENDLEYTIDSIVESNNPVAIIGGHYFLLYESKSDSLKPSVFQDFEDEGNKTFSLLRAKNFPLKTFKMTLQLINHFTIKKIVSKCVLVVDDDFFHKKEFRGVSHYELIKDRGYELRKKYFSSELNLPKSFIELIENLNLSVKNIFENFENSGKEDSYMPSDSIFISERRLCKQFKKTSKRVFNSEDIFISTAFNDDEYNNLTLQDSAVNQYCLIEDGLCNCGGKAFQLYYDIINKGYTNIVFFVPNECIESVNKGAEIIIKSAIFAQKNIIIINISSLTQETPNPIIKLNVFSTNENVKSRMPSTAS